MPLFTSTKKRLKRALFSLLPLILLLFVAEIVVRTWALDDPRFISGGSGMGPGSLMKRDPHLGWSLLPNRHSNRRGWSITTNSLGLRSPEVSPKKNKEFRILSLGESTTFGLGVPGSETYSALLQKLLQKTTSRPVTVINAGISAYSSFQSLKYLELQGLKLQPDLVLFYHEVNDYLPSVIRDHNLNEFGILKTDKELYDSRLHALNQWLLQKWALYAFLSRSVASYQIRRIENADVKNPVEKIGLPDFRVGDVGEIRNGTAVLAPDIDATALGRRVSDAERLENLTELISLCEQNETDLIIIHPSYRNSRRHECRLTRLCRERGVLMYEAHDALHRTNIPSAEMFLDVWHPSVRGHQALAEGLTHLIKNRAWKDTDG